LRHHRDNNRIRSQDRAVDGLISELNTFSTYKEKEAGTSFNLKNGGKAPKSGEMVTKLVTYKVKI
jgi:hypothetical protein